MRQLLNDSNRLDAIASLGAIVTVLATLWLVGPIVGTISRGFLYALSAFMVVIAGLCVVHSPSPAARTQADPQTPAADQMQAPLIADNPLSDSPPSDQPSSVLRERQALAHTLLNTLADDDIALDLRITMARALGMLTQDSTTPYLEQMFTDDSLHHHLRIEILKALNRTEEHRVATRLLARGIIGMEMRLHGPAFDHVIPGETFSGAPGSSSPGVPSLLGPVGQAPRMGEGDSDRLLALLQLVSGHRFDLASCDALSHELVRRPQPSSRLDGLVSQEEEPSALQCEDTDAESVAAPPARPGETDPPTGASA